MYIVSNRNMTHKLQTFFHHFCSTSHINWHHYLVTCHCTSQNLHPYCTCQIIYRPASSTNIRGLQWCGYSINTDTKPPCHQTTQFTSGTSLQPYFHARKQLYCSTQCKFQNCFLEQTSYSLLANTQILLLATYKHPHHIYTQWIKLNYGVHGQWCSGEKYYLSATLYAYNWEAPWQL